MKYLNQSSIERVDNPGIITTLKTDKLLCVDVYVGIKYISSNWIMGSEEKFIESIGGKLEDCSSISFGTICDNLSTSSGYVHNISSMLISECSNTITVKLTI